MQVQYLNGVGRHLDTYRRQYDNTYDAISINLLTLSVLVHCIINTYYGQIAIRKYFLYLLNFIAQIIANIPKYM